MYGIMITLPITINYIPTTLLWVLLFPERTIEELQNGLWWTMSAPPTGLWLLLVPQKTALLSIRWIMILSLIMVQVFLKQTTLKTQIIFYFIPDGGGLASARKWLGETQFADIWLCSWMHLLVRITLYSCPEVPLVCVRAACARECMCVPYARVCVHALWVQLDAPCMCVHMRVHVHVCVCASVRAIARVRTRSPNVRWHAHMSSQVAFPRHPQNWQSELGVVTRELAKMQKWHKKQQQHNWTRLPGRRSFARDLKK